jgi:hypothetical protein
MHRSKLESSAGIQNVAFKMSVVVRRRNCAAVKTLGSSQVLFGVGIARASD